MKLNGDWFIEAMPQEGSAIGFALQDKLHEETSNYQKIEVFQTAQFGRLMVIDGAIMLTGRDNFIYHEMLAHPVLFTHPRAKHVVIVGGGDCGTLNEVLKHEAVEQVTQVEIDERVTRLSEQFFPELCARNGDPRVRFEFTDAVNWMANATADSIDVIIVDSTDPVGPAEGLFGESFYRACHQALRPGGIVAQQSESPLLHYDLIKQLGNVARAVGFNATRTLHFPQPCYPSGWWSVTMARKQADLDGFRERGAAIKEFATRYYNVDIHRAAMALPEFMLNEQPQ